MSILFKVNKNISTVQKRHLMILLSFLFLIAFTNQCSSPNRSSRDYSPEPFDKTTSSTPDSKSADRKNETSSSENEISSGVYQGKMTGQVYNRSFELPVTIEVTPPIKDESNPVHLNFSAGSPNQIGSFVLTSGGQFVTPQSGRKVTLEFLSIDRQGSTLRANLNNTHKGAGAAGNNTFTAPNVTAEHAPDNMKDIYKSLGPEVFAFNEGTRILLNFDGGEIDGSIEGTGFSVTGIFPIPDVKYKGRMTARRGR